MKTRILFTANLILILIIGILSFFLWQYHDKYQQLSMSLLNPEEGLNRTVFNDEWLDSNEFILKNDHIFISLKLFETYVDSDYTLSGTGQRIYLKTENIQSKFENENLTQFVEANLNEINIPLLYEQDLAYLDLSVVERLYQLGHVYFSETNNLILFEDQKVYKGLIKVGTGEYQLVNADYVKTGMTSSSERAWIVGEYEGYYHVLNESGKPSYIKKKDVAQIEVQTAELKSFKTPITRELKQPFSFTFEVIDTYKDNFSKQSNDIEDGIDAIAPTWFNLNIDGIIINSADLSYSEFVRHQDIALWGLFKNNFDPKWTHTLLSSEAYQNKAIAQMLMFAGIYDLEGINLDFENIYLEDQDALSGFVKKLSSYTKQYNQTLTMDVTRPKGSDTWSKVYDRKTLSQYVDFMILMAYDEHWGSSPISGSVASLPWTEESITMSLEEIPVEKLVLGIPLYMRVWEEKPVTGQKYKKVGSRAITLSGFDKIFAERQLKLVYDEASGQHYTEYFEGNQKYRIWVEDNDSLNKRLELSGQYGLPGVATWRRGFERNETFSIISLWQDMMK